MKLQDVFNQLIYGELSQLYLGQDDEANVDPFGNPQMSEKDRLRITAIVQMGLTALHKRFRLKERRFKLHITPQQVSYVLKSDFAQSNDSDNGKVRYILDDSDPFKDDLLKVERVYDHEGTELTLNKVGDEEAVRTVSHNILVLPDHLVDPDYLAVDGRDEVTVVYRADHPRLDTINAQYAPFDTEVDLPVTHLEPLLYYVASRIMNPIGATGEFHEGNNYYQKFEMACQQLEKQNYQMDPEGVSTRFETNGWV